MAEPIELLTADQRAQLQRWLDPSLGRLAIDTREWRRWVGSLADAEGLATARLLAVEAELAAERQANADLRQAADEADADYRQVKVERDALQDQLDELRDDSPRRLERIVEYESTKELADLRDRLQSLLGDATLLDDGRRDREVIYAADLEQVLNAQPTQPEQP